MKNHLQFNWWKYLIILLLPIIVWCSVFESMAQPKQNEQINILYVGENLDAQSLQQQLVVALPGLTRQQLKSVTVDTMLPGGSSYASVLTARCYEYDILIFEESSLRENLGQSIFVRLTDELLAEFPGAAPYTEPIESGEALTFGLVLYDTEKENNFSSCYSGEESCYLFVSPYSVNFNALNENGTAGNDAALKAAQYLLEMTI